MDVLGVRTLNAKDKAVSEIMDKNRGATTDFIFQLLPPELRHGGRKAVRKSIARIRKAKGLPKPDTRLPKGMPTRDQMEDFHDARAERINEVITCDPVEPEDDIDFLHSGEIEPPADYQQPEPIYPLEGHEMPTPDHQRSIERVGNGELPPKKRGLFGRFVDRVTGKDGL